MRFWVGAYAPDAGSAEGIGILQAGDADSVWASGPLGMVGTAVAAPGSPSWVASHPHLDVLYAALEAEGTVQAYRRTGETSLAPLGAPVPAGEAVCHVAVAPDGSFLVASCWGDGRVVRIALDAAGRPSSPVIAAAASDPYSGTDDDFVIETRAAVSGAAVPDLAAAARALREAAGEEYGHLIPDYDALPETDAESEEAVSGARVSRAHETIVLPRGLLATTDMGLDLVRFWRPVGTGLRLVQEVALPKGSGPRHGVWHPSGHLYIVTELSREVFVIAPDGEAQMVNYRQVGGLYVVDRVFDQAELRLGDRRPQVVRIRRLSGDRS